jgi:uncharacterized protein YaiL (DUF2058 family)
MQSLKDKLLKAGLVTQEAAQKAEAEKAKGGAARAGAETRAFERRNDTAAAARPAFRQDGSANARTESRLPKFAPLAGSKEAHRQNSKKQLELDRAIREMVLGAQVPPERGETPFYFVTRKNKLRRLELSENQAKAIESGVLAVVERPDPDKIEHALVPAAVAKQLLPMHAKVVRFLKAPDASVGFLSESEISARAHEAYEPEGPDGSNSEGAPSAAEGSASPPEEAETWITIKRSPK